MSASRARVATRSRDLSFPSRIAATFESLRARDQMAFMPFITAGDPDISTTVELIRLLRDCGVDLIEVGFPYSDPIADGPVIQASYTRALEKKLHLVNIFEGLAALQGDAVPPLLAMVSYAIVFRTGPNRFVTAARDAGFAGLIVPDLPGDQADELFTIAREETVWISFSSSRRRRPRNASTASSRRAADLFIAFRSRERLAFERASRRN